MITSTTRSSANAAGRGEGGDGDRPGGRFRRGGSGIQRVATGECVWALMTKPEAALLTIRTAHLPGGGLVILEEPASQFRASQPSCFQSSRPAGSIHHRSSIRGRSGSPVRSRDGERRRIRVGPRCGLQRRARRHLRQVLRYSGTAIPTYPLLALYRSLSLYDLRFLFGSALELRAIQLASLTSSCSRLRIACDFFRGKGKLALPHSIRTKLHVF